MRASRQRVHRGGSLQRNPSIRGTGPAIHDRLCRQTRPARPPVQTWKPQHRPSGGSQSVQDAKRYSPPQRVLRRAVVPPRTIFNTHNDIEPSRFRKHFLNFSKFQCLKLCRRTISVPKGLTRSQRTLGVREACLPRSGRNLEFSNPPRDPGASEYRLPTSRHTGWRGGGSTWELLLRSQQAHRYSPSRRKRCNGDYSHRQTGSEAHRATPGKRALSRVLREPPERPPLPSPAIPP